MGVFYLWYSTCIYIFFQVSRRLKIITDFLRLHKNKTLYSRSGREYIHVMMENRVFYCAQTVTLHSLYIYVNGYTNLYYDFIRRLH